MRTKKGSGIYRTEETMIKAVKDCGGMIEGKVIVLPDNFSERAEWYKKVFIECADYLVNKHGYDIEKLF